MKLKKLKTINEAIEDIAVSKEDYGTMGFVMADAIRTSKKNRERADAVMHEKIKELPNEDRFAHTKDKGTPEMKKMHLSEDAFQTIDLRNRGNKSRKALKESVDIDVQEIYSHFMSGKFSDEEIVDELIDAGMEREEAFDTVEKWSSTDIKFESLREASGDNKLVKFMKDAYADLTQHDSDAVWHYKLGNGLYYVMACYGDPANYDQEDVKLFATSKNGVSIVLGKIAVNSDDLQSDYGWDWTMPYYEDNGDVWDTEREFYKEEDFNRVAQEIMSEYEKMKDLEIDEEGRIIKSDKVEESFLNETGEVDSKKCADILNNWIDWTEVDETGDVDFAIDQLRSLASEKQITEEEYDFIMSNWDDLLKEGLSCSNKDKKLEEGMKFGQSSYDDAVKVVIDYYRDHSAEDALESIFNEFQMINEDEAYKLVYSLAERVEEFVGEDLEDSQKYPIESPFEKKEGSKDGLKATQKYPVESPMKKKDSQFVKAEQKAPIGESLNESVKIISDLGDFKPWSGAIDTWDKIVDAGKLDTLDFMLEDMYPDGISDVGLNDLLWHDAEWVLDMVGISEEQDDEEHDEDEIEDVEESLDKNKMGKGSEYDIDVSPEEADKLAESLVNTINSLENN